jgi:L-cysteine:1D-myo-inositol 2-amino-2-deoxy-alpha-D-glucopyranoside ligase
MSKSKGNLLFVSTLRSHGADAAAMRLALLADHYRTDRDWTDEHLAVANDRLARWRAAVDVDAGPPAEQVLADVRRLLADDLDTPNALAAIDRWTEEARHRGGSDKDSPRQVRDLALALLGLKL